MADTEIYIPSWLDETFLINVLQEKDPSSQIHVLSYNVKPAVPKGDNYACILLRVSIDYEKDGKPAHTSIIIKTPPNQGESKKIVDDLGIVDKECIVYKELLPIMNNLMNKMITPKDYSCKIPGTLIFDDLKEDGYVMGDRLEQLDFDHCNAFMKAIATFHSLALHIQQQNPELIERVGEERIFRADLKPENKEWFTLGMGQFAAAVERWEGFEYVSKFTRDDESTVWGKVVQVNNGGKHLKVLNHGDTWTNNMMFKHDDSGRVTDVKLIYLQMCKLTSPAVDLVKFLITSAQEDVKEYRLQELFATYLETFNSTLEAVGCEERLSPDQLQDELEFVEDLGLSFTILHSYGPYVLCEKEDVMDMEDIIKAYKNPDDIGQARMRQLNGEHFKKVAQYTIKKLEQKGFYKNFK